MRGEKTIDKKIGLIAYINDDVEINIIIKNLTVMLSERKRYNYNVAPPTHASRHSSRTPSSMSAYKSTVLYQNENINIDHIE